MKVTTTHQWKQFLDINDIPAKALEDYEHLSDDASATGWFKYCNQYHHISDFLRIDSQGLDVGSVLKDWDAYAGNCWSSATVIKVSNDGDMVKVGTYS